MDKQKLNEKVLEFKQTRCETAFSEIYGFISGKYFGKEKELARSFRVDELDLIALQDDKLLESIEKYERGKGDFENYFSVIMFNARKRMAGKMKTHRSREELLTVKEGESDAATFDRLTLLYGTAATEDVSDIIARKKETDQRQLIDSLMIHADSSTAEIVREILSDRTLKRDFNSTAIGQVTKIDRSRIKRKLRNLARSYDSNTYGNYREYLCV